MTDTIQKNKQKMQVGIAGAGAISLGYSAFLLESGHTPCIWSPSGRLTTPGPDVDPVIVTGAVDCRFRPTVCTSAKDLARNDVVILALPAYGHRAVLDCLLPHIETRHCIIISGHLSFAALYLSKKLADRGIQIPIAVWNTTALTAKTIAPGEVKVGVIRTKVDMATVPVVLCKRAHEICRNLFGDRFAVKDDVLTIMLSNLNPQNHMGIALCNLTRIERAETWHQNTNVTPMVARLLEALDQERLSIAAAFGKSVRTLQEHFALSYGVSGDSMSDVFQRLAATGNNPLGPQKIDTRYILEDVPFGLAATIFLARISGVSATLHENGVQILSACYGRDLAADNNLLGELGQLDRKSLETFVVNGVSSVVR